LWCEWRSAGWRGKSDLDLGKRGYREEEKEREQEGERGSELEGREEEWEGEGKGKNGGGMWGEKRRK